MEKEIYGECYDLVVPDLVPGGLLVADNAISHQEALKPMIDRALTDSRVDAAVVPIGKGELVCRKVQRRRRTGGYRPAFGREGRQAADGPTAGAPTSASGVRSESKRREHSDRMLSAPG